MLTSNPWPSHPERWDAKQRCQGGPPSLSLLGGSATTACSRSMCGAAGYSAVKLESRLYIPAGRPPAVPGRTPGRRTRGASRPQSPPRSPRVPRGGPAGASLEEPNPPTPRYLIGAAGQGQLRQDRSAMSHAAVGDRHSPQARASKAPRSNRSPAAARAPLRAGARHG